MENLINQIINGIDLRIDGPMKFRLILQPLMSLIFAYKAGMRAAKAKDKPFVKGIIQDKDRRKEFTSEIWKDVGKLFILALILDIVFQIIVLNTVHPIGAIVTAVFLAIIPYLIFRGIITRLFEFINRKKID